PWCSRLSGHADGAGRGDPVRVGIIGTNWGRMHVGGFRGAGVEIAGLCGSDREKTARIAREEGVALATTRVDELCAAVDVVGVVGVAGAPEGRTHAHTGAAGGGGCQGRREKPRTGRTEGARALAGRAGELAASGRRCAVSFPYRMSPPLVALQGWLEQREP